MEIIHCSKCELNPVSKLGDICQCCKESKQKEVRPRQKKIRTVPRKNIAFKCNYCDGGNENNGIGFSGICSDDNMKYNVAHKVWCGANECFCKQYLNGTITREQLEELYNKDNRCLCYESHLLVNWEMAAGVVVRGKNKGMPNRLLGVKTNSLCVLTTQPPSGSSKDRFIIGVFLVNRSDEGDDVNAGSVTAHDTYRIPLTISEAQKMSFWDYYQNNSDKAATQWGTGLFRYIDDDASIKILKDIVDIKNDPKEKDLARDFLKYYTVVNHLSI